MRGDQAAEALTQADKRLPITPLILKAILVVIKDPTNFTNIMMWAACRTGYFAFLQSGEFTVNEPFDISRHLSIQDVAVDSYRDSSLISIHNQTVED